MFSKYDEHPSPYALLSRAGREYNKSWKNGGSDNRSTAFAYFEYTFHHGLLVVSTEKCPDALPGWLEEIFRDVEVSILETDQSQQLHCSPYTAHPWSSSSDSLEKSVLAEEDGRESKEGTSLRKTYLFSFFE